MEPYTIIISVAQLHTWSCKGQYVETSNIENNIVSSNSKIMSKNLSQELRYRLVTSPGHPT